MRSVLSPPIIDHSVNPIPSLVSLPLSSSCPPPPPLDTTTSPSPPPQTPEKVSHAITQRSHPSPKMITFRHFLIPIATLFIYSSLLSFSTSEKASVSSIYEALKVHGLPIGLLPKGVQNFSFDNSGKFQVHLDQACNAKFEDELHYDKNITGNLQYGKIDELSGIKAQDLFLWFPVIEIRVDIPSSGLIYFNVGVVSKQFSLSSFETPRDCLAAPGPSQDFRVGLQAVETASKIRLQKQYGFDQDNAATMVM